MAGVNKAIILGNLGRDPEMRTTQSGQQVASFSIATSRQWTNREGERQEETEWHRVVAWGRLAEICGQYLQKGKQVYIEGRIQTRKWQDKDGNDRWTTEIVAQEMQMLGRAGDAPSAVPSEGGAMAASSGGGTSYGGGGGGGGGGGNVAAEDEDLPF